MAKVRDVQQHQRPQQLRRGIRRGRGRRRRGERHVSKETTTNHKKKLVTVLSNEAHKVPLAVLLGESLLDTSVESGLPSHEVQRRRTLYGTNELRVKTEKHILLRFLDQFKNFFALLLIVGYVICIWRLIDCCAELRAREMICMQGSYDLTPLSCPFIQSSGLLAVIAEQLDPGQGNLYIAIALFAVVLLNATFSFIQEEQSERIMESFRKMLPTMVRVRRNGGIVSECDASELVPGDVVLLFEGDKVPADGRLIEGHDLKVDLSSLTGESEPVLLDPNYRNEVNNDGDGENVHEESIINSRNMVFSGSLVNSGDGEVMVCLTGMQTQIGKIIQLTKETEAVQTPIGRELRYFVRVISAIAIFLGISFFIISVALGRSAISSLIFAIGIIVANVPEVSAVLRTTYASRLKIKRSLKVKNPYLITIPFCDDT